MGKLTENQWDELITEYKAGGTTMALAEKFGVVKSTVRLGLKKRSVKFHPKNFFDRKRAASNTNMHAFDTITPESAYWTGFLMADACVTDSNAVILTLASVDRGHVEKFKSFMQSSNPIRDHRNGRSNTAGEIERYASTICFYGEHLANKLISYGVTPRKSFSAKACDDLAANKDFFRGVIDGDGHIKLRLRKNRKPGTYIAMLELYGSEHITQQFAAFAETIIGGAAHVRPKKNIFVATVHGTKAYKLIKYLYEDAEVFLDRKMEEAKEIIDYYEKKLASA